MFERQSVSARRVVLISCLCLLLPIVIVAGRDNRNGKNIKPRKLGESLNYLRRDTQGKLVSSLTTEAGASYVEKAEAQPPTANSDDDVITLDSKLFAFEVTVYDPAKQRFVIDLKEEDFIIYDDNQEQPVNYFVASEVEKVPTSIVLILDHSGSITPYWEESKKAALNFVRQLKPEYQTAALALDDPSLLVDYTNDIKLLEKELSKVKLTKHTYNFTTLFAVMQEMFADRDGRKVIIFQTDGDEALKLVPQKEWPEDVTARFEYQPKFYTLQDITEYAANSGITIYSIAVGRRLIDLEQQPDKAELAKHFVEQGRDPILISYFRECQAAVKTVAQVTGGSTSFMAQASDATSIYNNIKEDLRARYIIGFYPNSNQTGRYHRITVKVKDHPNWLVTNRQGYFAAKK